MRFSKQATLAVAAAVLVAILGRGLTDREQEWDPCSPFDMTHKLCTPLSHMTWHLTRKTANGSVVAVPSYTRETACWAMFRAGFTNIELHGDSFMRHLTQALLLIFSGDYDSGSLNAHAKAIVECQGDYQFSEKGCSVNGSLVNEPLRLSVSAGAEPPLCQFMGHPVGLGYSGSENFQCGGGNSSIQLFSSGNHALPDKPWSINNASAAMQNFLASKTCAPETQRCAAAFVSTHHRIAIFPDGHQGYEDVKNFNLGMRGYIEGGACGPTFSYIDTYNFTEALVLAFRNESLSMTHDGVHWSRTVNLLKAQLVLHHFLS